MMLVCQTAALRIAAPEPEDTEKPLLAKTIEQGTTDLTSESEAVLAQFAALEKYEDQQLEKSIQEVHTSREESAVDPHHRHYQAKPHKEFIFLQPPHTASMTVQTALSEAIGRPVTHTHHNLLFHIKQMEHQAGDLWENWDKKVTFAFVRNPWERVLSCAGWKGVIAGSHSNVTMTKEEEIQKFRKFVQKLGAKRFIQNGACAYLGNQVDWVYAKRPTDTEARNQLTFVGHTNNIQEDFYKVCDLIGVPRVDINSVAQHCASSCDTSAGTSSHVAPGAPRKHRDYREYYDEQTKHVVARLMYKDIQAFGFEYGK